jgi:hypothetical protein
MSNINKNILCLRFSNKSPDFTPLIYLLSTNQSAFNTYTVVNVQGYNFFPGNTVIFFGETILPVSYYGSTGLSFVVPMLTPRGTYEVRAANVTNFYPLYPPVQKKSNIAYFSIY